jgi:hypothetical protein
MADEKTSETPREQFLKPLVNCGKILVLFLDVATLMLRMMINTVVHDNPAGKPEIAEERGR